jgi:hypothetical protein
MGELNRFRRAATLNLPGPYNFLPFVLLAFMASESASATNDGRPRVNPFELPPGVYTKENAPIVQTQNLKLQAIFNIEGKHIATISGGNFRKGDFAFGKKVIDISNNQVILDAGGKQEILTLEQTRFRIQKGNKK